MFFLVCLIHCYDLLIYLLNSSFNSCSCQIVYKQADVSIPEPSQVMRDIDLSPGQPLQPSASTGSLGVIGRRSVSDLGAIGDNITSSTANSGGMHDQFYNLQMLEGAFHRLPQPKDSERAKSYTPVCNHLILDVNVWPDTLFTFPCFL